MSDVRERRSEERERWEGLKWRPDWPLLKVMVNEVRLLSPQEREGLDYAAIGQGWLVEQVNVRLSFAVPAEEAESLLWTLLQGNLRHLDLEPERLLSLSHVHKPVSGLG